MANEFWLNDRQWSAIEALLPRNQPGARRVDDRRVISGIVHVLKVGCRWEDCPALYGPSTTVYNRFNRWSRRGLWQRLFEAYGSGENFADVSRRLGCHKRFNWVNWTWGRQHRKTARSNVYFYHFSHPPPLPGEPFAEGHGATLGACPAQPGGGAFLLGTLTRRANQTGAMIGMACGFAVELFHCRVS